jgi:hypothetical protein
MSQQKNQVCGTACCDCTVACKYNIIEDLYVQDTESFAHFMEVNNDVGWSHLLLKELIFGEGEIAMIQKFVKILQTRFQSISNWCFEKYEQKPLENTLLNTEKGLS